MRILAIETTTHSGGIAIVEKDVVRASLILNVPRTHSQRLLRDIDFLLTECELEVANIDGIAVSLGPGSFTGVRIGLACAKGLAFASGKPLVGISTLEALAIRSAERGILLCPVLDARRGEVFAAGYRLDAAGYKLSMVLPGRAEPLDRFLERIEEPALFSGDGSLKFQGVIKEHLGDMARFAPADRNLPSAIEVAILGQARLASGEVDDIASLQPVYLRAPDARLPINPSDKSP